MNKTLFVAWQDDQRESVHGQPSRGWFPIGRLDADPSIPLYSFRYTGGALKAKSEAGFVGLDSFPDWHHRYESDELFPTFRNRLLNLRRPDYPAFLERLGLPPNSVDPVEILAVSGGEKQTDHLEVFPRIQKNADGSFVARFFLHGSRHVSEEAQRRVASLQAGERLQVAIELDNPVTGAAIQLQVPEEYLMIGWSPRYLVVDLLHAVAEASSGISARVVRVNPPPAPLRQRVLVEMIGKLPNDFEPMSGEDYQELSPPPD